ncbi:hypothetical protein [Alistipes senegalensis]|uniref:Uncharacterized protein n=1 Tax=Alistipes senegalensis JC50 TaxID=1033732 RepID=A0ABY5V948_9BACT|nr:hypothetical protein [Alistipes senegalensis]UEA86222.1 hypothetical protein LK406_10965 [Alistipes senegalensis]UWN66191.1 hypothetical protein NQ519_04980 [Alistipes senegalensis JC50]
MKIDEKTVSMTGDEFEVFSRLIDTVTSQSEMIRKLTRENLGYILQDNSSRTQQESFTQAIYLNPSGKLPS